MNRTPPREGQHRPNRRHLRGAMALLAVLALGALAPATALGDGADLALSVDVSPSGPVALGQIMTITVTVTNTSPSNTTNWDPYFTEILPGDSSDPREPSAGHVQWISQAQSTPDFACNDKPNPADTPPYGTMCRFSRQMVGGESVSLTITGRADRAGHAVNYAGVVSQSLTTDADSDDPNEANNGTPVAFEIVKPAPSVKRGDARDNTLTGGPGPDSLFGRGGDDILRGLAGDDILDGGAGDDQLIGGPGDDRITGGPGRDVISAGPGRDTVNSADGVIETVDCGSGRDSVTADATDRLRGCEIRHLRH